MNKLNARNKNCSTCLYNLRMITAIHDMIFYIQKHFLQLELV